MCVALGGRLAEEIINGRANVTTGASNDFQQCDLACFFLSRGPWCACVKMLIYRVFQISILFLHIYFVIYFPCANCFHVSIYGYTVIA